MSFKAVGNKSADTIFFHFTPCFFYCDETSLLCLMPVSSQDFMNAQINKQISTLKCKALEQVLTISIHNYNGLLFAKIT